MHSENPDHDPQKMLDRYLHDYLIKKKLHNTAEIFRSESNLTSNPVAVDAPNGFLYDWWSMFYSVYKERESMRQEAKVSTEEFQAEKMKKNEPTDAHPTVTQATTYEQSRKQFPSGPTCVVGQPAASLNQEQHTMSQKECSNFQPKDSKINFPVSASVGPSHLQQQLYNQDEKHSTESNINDLNLRKTIGINPATSGVQDAVPPISGLRQEVMSQTSGKLNSAYSGGSGNNCSHNLIPPSCSIGAMDRQGLNSPSQAADHQTQFQLLSMDRQTPGQLSTVLSGSSGSSSKHSPIIPNYSMSGMAGQSKDITDVSRAPFSNLKRGFTASQIYQRGFSLKEIAHLNTSKSKLLCCQFSSDGQLLACAGHQKKVTVWDVQTFDFLGSLEGHSHLITDVRFRPNSSVFATSSFDKTVQLWDAIRPNRSLIKLLGHNERVMSLDFHPRKDNLLWSCDSNSEIRIWNSNEHVCKHISKQVGNRQVRLQPRTGSLLAATVGNCINMIEVESDSLLFSLKGHANAVLALCWDPSGNYIASVSEDSARVWSIFGGKCIHALHSSGDKFQSCTFHPRYSQVLTIGGDQTLKLWSPNDGNTLSIAAHKGLISALADSVETKRIASASHDKSVKLWK